jgi:fructose-1,6-bisphosphatase II
VILDRPCHACLVQEVRATGARIKLITDGDVAAAIAAADPTSAADMLIGIGGAPEAVLAAAAIRYLGGALQCRIAPRSEEDHWRLEGQGIDLERIYAQDDLVASENVYFAATGITSGDLLPGVEYRGTTARTHSIIMRGQTGTIRRMEAT